MKWRTPLVPVNESIGRTTSELNSLIRVRRGQVLVISQRM